MSGKIFMYGDQESVNLLNRDVPKVVLIGGYLGYSNFGDILQLKEALSFHAKVTGLEPVVICHVAAIPDADFLSRLRGWFRCRTFVFIHDHHVDMAQLNMQLIDRVLPIENLHLYGGGFLNRYWGEYFLKLIEGLLHNFGVDKYIIGGQQLDAELADRLKAHLEKYRPRLVGARDAASLAILSSIGYQGEFSFDDASNIIQAWSRRKPEQSSPNQCLFIHLNSSRYTGDHTGEQGKGPGQIVQVLKRLAEKFNGLDPVFLSAYSEYRLSVKDTLATIISLEDALPFLNYRVLDIAHMALLHDPASTAPDCNLAPFGGGVAVSSSYHTAMFCNMLGTPCYLLSWNAYYRQKQAGLGERRTFEQFLDNPTVLSYGDCMEQREGWLKKLSLAFSQGARKGMGTVRAINYTQAELTPLPFRFKEA